jgi:hypothetical protein
MNSPACVKGDSAGLFEPGVVANFILYQIAWLACVVGAAAGLPGLGTATAGGVIVWHLAHASRPPAELRLILLTGLIGGAWDSLLVGLGLIHYPSGTLLPWLAPHWIIALWMAFATTFNSSFRWLKGRVLPAAIFGLVGGPLAWWAGDRLGALELIKPARALAALGGGWMALLPILMRLAMRFDGVSGPASADRI